MTIVAPVETPMSAASEPVIKKQHILGTTRPNLIDYEAERSAFSWHEARRWLSGLPGGGINIAHEAVDRHLETAVADRDALRIVHQDESVSHYSYRQLAAESSRFAHALDSLGVQPGAPVFTLLGRRLELYATILGTLKNRCVFTPLFTAYGPEPICQRLRRGDAEVLVTTKALYRRKVMAARETLPKLRHVILVDGDEPETLRYEALVAPQSDIFRIASTYPTEMAVVHFTSGTTGTPKGAIHVHEAVVAHYATGLYALDLHPDDVYWCTADPGWVTGTSYGVIAPLCHGVTVVVDEAEFEPTRWWRILERERVTVWYTAPTALRMLMRGTEDPRQAHDLSALRFIASVGEPLNPEVVRWGERTLGLPVHDNWWQTETGGIMIANFAACDIKPGSMGRPLPGIEPRILRRNELGAPVVVGGRPVEADPGEVGVLALRRGWPSMFRGYLHEEARYDASFCGSWYVTGDLAYCDDEGWYWFVGRGDDVIKSAGHLIGPFEVESALVEHPAVLEAGVVGKPDVMAGELVVAFVALRPPNQPTDELRRELLGFTRQRLGAAVAPREITFVDDLPHTESGKIIRRLLKERT